MPAKEFACIFPFITAKSIFGRGISREFVARRYFGYENPRMRLVNLFAGRLPFSAGRYASRARRILRFVRGLLNVQARRTFLP